jgi:hypothetical protein
MSTTKEVPANIRSHGRGGAGNFNSKPGSSVDVQELQTPTIKTSTYTTGRGGSGNMAKYNPDDPTEARLAQDVEAPAHHNKEMQGTYHWGRGGEGNMTTLGKSGAEQARERSKDRKKTDRTLSHSSGNDNGNGSPHPEKKRSGSFLGRAKELLGLDKDKHGGHDPNNESAIE